METNDAPLAAAVALLLVLAACTANPPKGEDAELRELLDVGELTVEEFFGSGFPRPFRVEIAPDRESFDAILPIEWGMTPTQCWMVATGVEDALRMLSPRAWSTEACEHDPTDEVHVRGIVIHELVHVFHDQANPAREFEGMDPVGWFVEGLAVYASGQLEEGHLAEPTEAVAVGLAPERLENAWSGKYRYGVSGSIVKFLDATYGRQALRDMITATTETELLAVVGQTEVSLLAAWRDYVLASAAAGSDSAR